MPSEIEKINRVNFTSVDINNLKVEAIGKYFECDAKGIDENKEEILIEFYYTHGCEPEKIDLYKKSQKTSVEVDIRKIDQIEPSETNDYILINAPRKWISPPKITCKPEGNDKSIFEEFIWPLLKIGGKEMFLQSEKLYIKYFKKPKKIKWWQF